MVKSKTKFQAAYSDMTLNLYWNEKILVYKMFPSWIHNQFSIIECSIIYVNDEETIRICNIETHFSRITQVN